MSDLKDPRVFFAAERTLLAWNRTGLTLMAFGFMIERFGLFVHMIAPQTSGSLQRHSSFWIGVAFILLGALATTAAVIQYRTVLKSLNPNEIPAGYRVNIGVITNIVVAILGTFLITYLIMHGPSF